MVIAKGKAYTIGMAGAFYEADTIGTVDMKTSKGFNMLMKKVKLDDQEKEQKEGPLTSL